ncbi:hypothetical protein DFH27DRAFT_605258 [Peziza echinospora]|nr:hypothetical protein DFH27DRAFT_605258 [Peziza echinospora]
MALFDAPVIEPVSLYTYGQVTRLQGLQQRAFSTQDFHPFSNVETGGQTDESRFYDPFNVLLNYLFPFEGRYMIVPQWKRPEQSRSMRERFEDLGGRVHIASLYGMSSLGTKVCFYKYDKDTGNLWPRVSHTG